MRRNFCARLMAVLLVYGANGAYAQDAAPWAEVTSAIGEITEQPVGVQTDAQFENLRRVGQALFEARFTTPDGAGRPMATQAIIPTKSRRENRTLFSRTSGADANSCASCHNEPFVGGAGGFVTNVFANDGFNNADFDTTDPEFSNERGTNHMFGAGLIELLAREMSADLAALRRNALETARASNAPTRVALLSKGVAFGHLSALPDGIVDLTELDGVDDDLVIRPFSQKGVIVSLRQFTINAMNQHHGMQALERWGTRWTAQNDFDEDGVADELGAGDISALVAWQASLPPPEIWLPENADWQQAAARGEVQFSQLGCNDCHRQYLPLRSLVFSDPGPLDLAGTLAVADVEQAGQYNLAMLDWASTLGRNADGDYLVSLFGDLKRHKMTDGEIDALGNELFSQRFVGRDVFMTAELWGVGSTDPYGHRNDFTTLNEIILAHGGDARSARDAYANLESGPRSDLIAYLKTLRILGGS